jgi:hypothetical protein
VSEELSKRLSCRASNKLAREWKKGFNKTFVSFAPTPKRVRFWSVRGNRMSVVGPGREACGSGGNRLDLQCEDVGSSTS